MARKAGDLGLFGAWLIPAGWRPCTSPPAPIRERYLDIAPDGASGRTEIAWPVLRMAG
jgi:hypothetical protein